MTGLVTTLDYYMPLVAFIKQYYNNYFIMLDYKCNVYI